LGNIKLGELKSYFVYILECENGNYYTGYTNDIAKRFKTHSEGKKQGAKFTRSFKPKKIAACWQIAGEKNVAMKVEYFIKKHTRADKQIFIKFPETLKDHFCAKLDAPAEITVYKFDISE